MVLSRWVIGSVAAVLAQTAAADLVLQQPVDCTLGDTCVIQQFMDHDTTDGIQDFTCDEASYDGHKGTDFRISAGDMQRGVNVLAAADGVILGLRDGMVDRRAQSQSDLDAVSGKECGNGMVLRHENGWETQYCHMKQGSVIGEKGTTIKAGTVIGQIGLSGRTQFAHLHLSVRKDGKPVDPFSPEFDSTRCTYEPESTLWDPDFAERFTYQPTKVVTVGLADTGPSVNDVMDGNWSDFQPKSDAPLVVYGIAVNGKTDDVLELTLEGPTGQIITSKRPPLEKRKAQWFGFAGKRAPAGGWAAGEYHIHVNVLRDGRVLHSETRTMTLN
ncbi:M23 family metallopeptidase [Amylibacter sp. IMCC11727]|uniref:M23 family metallopeptidase n=1 Tax=Amylibacter sp. IMCC11727 TaxID=3039851 RepID=UPI00244E5A85|nr:M23 family metallopeptidase [Amylibacter sp. IMCC11727]WGI20678.1 M23 family metallopeptidase [Amylibacter sp. IMCC11727]